MRQRTAYGLMGLNLFLLGVLVGLILVVAGIRSDVKQSAASANLGCKRANVQRDATRFLLLARVHDSQLIASSSTNKEIADYFKAQQADSQMKLNSLLASAALTFPLDNDKFLIDCDKSFPLP